MDLSSAASRLIGVWSADARYGPGAQSDYLVWFEPDGRGRLDFVNFVLCTVEFFEWAEISSGVLRIRWTRTLQWVGDTIGDGVVEETGPLADDADLPFRIGEELCPRGEVLEVVHIDLDGPDGAFARWHPTGAFDTPAFGL